MSAHRNHKSAHLFWMAIAIFTLPACISAGVQSAPPASQSQSPVVKHQKVKHQKVKPMTPQQIVEHILQKDWDMVEAPGAIPPEAGPEIIKLLDNEDPQVRELAIYSLNAASGQAAKEGMLKGLDDDNDMVRSAACKSLLYNYDGKYLQEYMGYLKSNEDEFVREHVALVIGKIGSPKAVEAVKEQMRVEKDADAQHAMAIALARMKDSAGTQEFVGRLQASEPMTRVTALEDYLYIRDRELLPEITKLLSDMRDAKNMAPSGHKYFIRVCDVAVNTLDLVLGHPFSFQVDPMKRYTDDELYEAQRVVAAVK